METAASYGSAALSGVSTFIVLLGVFLPEIAILAGFLSDLMNVQVRHMPTSAFGVLAAVLNWGVALLIGPKPANASFFSLPERNAVSASSSPEAAAISKLTSLFPPTLLGVASPLAMGNATAAAAPTPTNTVQAARQIVAAANPIPVPVPAPLAGVTGTPPDTANVSNRPDGNTPSGSVFQFNFSGYPASGVGGPNPSAFPIDSEAKASQAARRDASAANAAGVNQLKNLNRVKVGSVSQVGAPEGGGKKKSQKGGGARLTDIVNDQFNPCAVRGLGAFDVAKRPMGIAVLTTIFFVYLLDMSVNKKRNTNEQIAYWGVAIAVLGVNIYAHMKLSCVDGLFSASVFVPLIIGLVVGGAAFGIYQNLGPSYLPMDSETPSGSSVNAPTGQYSACASGNGGDFVCDAYLNGRRIGTVSPSTGEIA